MRQIRFPRVRIAIASMLTMLCCLAQPAAAADKITVLTGPVLLYDAIWMADVKGFYKAEGLDIEYRLFPTGATALQTFKTGQGDIVLTGDLPAVTYWENNHHDYRMINILERDSKGYTITADKTITKPSDLVGKVIATRVGANGSFFISEYLRKNGLKPTDVTIKNLDAQILPSALCRGDISAYFIWQPFGQRAIEICPDKAHQLATAEGYVTGYAVAGARPDWLDSKEGGDKAIRFLRATAKGAAVAAADFAAVADYAKTKYEISESAARFQWDINERVQTFDARFNEEFCRLNGWMIAEGMIKQPVPFDQFIWLPGVQALGSGKLVRQFTPCKA